MTYSVLIFAYRKPGTTPEQFRAHYEGKHVPLVKELSGEYVPGHLHSKNNRSGRHRQSA